MKTILLLLISLMLSSGGSGLRSETVTIPASNLSQGSQSFPLSANFGYVRSEMLYMASEVGSFGIINEIAFYLNYINLPMADSIPIVIKMKTTTETQYFTGVTYDDASAGAVTVFDGMIYGTDFFQNFWTAIQLQTPYHYDQNNLAIFIETNYGNEGGELNFAKGFRSATSHATNIPGYTPDAGAPARLRHWTNNFTPPSGLSVWEYIRPNIRMQIYAVDDCNVYPDSVLAPEKINFSCGVDEFTSPVATIMNATLTDQYDITVDFEITGPVNYTSQQTVDTIFSFQQKEVMFSGFNIKTPGDYNAQVRTSFLCNGVLTVQDTIDYSFKIINPNFGGGEPINNNYFFANSTACGMNAPNNPEFYWSDTTGSVSLIVNGQDVSGGVMSGSIDDGFFSLGNILPSGDKFRYCGVDYDSFFVGTNGQIGFLNNDNNYNGLVEYSPDQLPFFTPAPALFPLWTDLQFDNEVITQNRISYKSDAANNKLIITYDRAPKYGADDSTEYVSFQIILETSPGPVEDGLIIIQYDASKTGDRFKNFIDEYTLCIGMQNELATNSIQYRYTSNGIIYSHGPVFGSSLALAFGTNSAVLPVELSSFTSAVSERDVKLNWTTTSEINNSGFSIERTAVSQDNWTSAGSVTGNGTTGSSSNYEFTDRNVNAGRYKYRLKQTDFNGSYEYYELSGEVSVELPEKFNLSQNYPNPFNPSTKINYDLPSDGKVSLKLYDISGREIVTLVNEVQPAGYYTLSFNGSNLSSGAYFYRISVSSDSRNFNMTKKMMLIK
ncbi:MAG: T9SS type A sorting domain-containing protein [Ignavibacteria bacterium]|nr:T9SS type A sorting domain-containing protein [Ignavibacteria bacterium]